MSSCTMLIGELSRTVGMPASTVRYYERIGLLPAPPRERGCRRYDEDTIRRLRLIQLGKRIGFTLRELKGLSRALDGSATPWHVWRSAAARRATELRSEIDQARLALVLLERSLDCRCRSLESCAAVTGLGEALVRS